MAPEKKQNLGSVLVIGGCGFVGSHIVEQLLLNWTCSTISVLDLRTTKNRHDKVEYYDGDITSRDSVLPTLQKIKPAVIIHTASPPAVMDDSSSKAKKAANKLFYKVNVEGTKNLLDCAVEVGTVKAFVYTSSASVIHDNVSDLINADERFPVLHGSMQKYYYSDTKGQAEEIVLAYNRQQPDSSSPTSPTSTSSTSTTSKPTPTKMLTCALRPASVFGEGDPAMIPNMIRAYKKGQTRFQLGGNDNLFDFTYVGNVAHAHILASHALLQTSTLSTEPLDNERVDGQAFFITNGSPVYFWDFARTIWFNAGDTREPRSVWVIDQEIGLLLALLIEWIVWVVTFGGSPNLTREKVRLSSMARYYSIDKAVKRLGYVPVWGLEESVERSVKWFLDKEGKESETKKEK